jgi:hypothetical protein
VIKEIKATREILDKPELPALLGRKVLLALPGKMGETASPLPNNFASCDRASTEELPTQPCAASTKF